MIAEFVPPRKNPGAARLWAGRGEGYPCTCCGRPVQADETQYEIEAKEGEPSKRFHIGCYDEWLRSAQ